MERVKSMSITTRIPRNVALEERLIIGFSDILYKEVGTNLDHGWTIVDALVSLISTVAYRSGAESEEDVVMFSNNVKQMTVEALTFMIHNKK